MTTNTTPTDLKASPEETRRPFPPEHRTPDQHDAPKKRHPLRWIIVLLLVAGVAGYVVYQAGHPAPTAKKGGRGRGAGGGPIPVAVAPATRAGVPVYLNGIGNVQAFYTDTIRSRVDGQLMSVMFREGDDVKEGQVLAQIDPRPYQVQLEQAEGQLAHDQALQADAKLDLERYRTLLAQDAIPKQQLDTQIATVGQYEGSIKQDTANIDSAKLQLVYAKITAPISGRVGLRLVDPGNIVHATDTNGMLVITQMQPITAIFTIPEDNLPEVLRKLHAGVRLSLEAWNRDSSKKLDSGYLLTVDNQIDPTTGTSRLKAVFPNKNFTLFPSQFVNIRLLVDTQQNQVVIPTVAIQRGQQGAYVYTASEDGTAHLQTVQPGITEGNNTSIRAGLNGGEQVVIDGFDRLADKAKIRIRPAMAPATINPTGLDMPAEDNSADAPQGGRGRGGHGKGKNGPPPGQGTRSTRKGLQEGQKQ
ncbi:MAG TPA: MdtA/MuxA family multidrug efflux RND transporter periplasmic adaptor subunit [Bryobacteraceae bacterium]|nr:MdtA/MuxA family multidrug efflux RND transporter periplasmic adaptor subunit [Bryobacteraceae bacterium]